MRRLYPPQVAGPLHYLLPSPYPDVAFPEPTDGRPYIFINMAMTLDGKVVTGNPKAGFILSGSEGDRRGMAELRAQADAVMIGAGTVRAENPVLNIRYEDLRQRRVAEGRKENPCPIVVTNTGRLDPEARIFTQPGAIILTSERGAENLPDEIKSKADLITAGKETVDLNAAMNRLRRELDLRYLLVEGGPTLTHEFIATENVDEMFLTIAPLIKSGSDTPSLVEGPPFPYGELPKFCLLSIAEENGELYLRYGRDIRTAEEL